MFMKIKELRKMFNDKYTIKKSLGNGGNAIVYLACDDKTQEEFALKILENTGATDFKEKCDRFIIEAKKVFELQSAFKGIIPIGEFHLPDEIHDSLYWYTMPVATIIKKHFNENINIIDIVKCIIELSNTLADLHDLDIVHRDIKPSNLYHYNGQFCLADFGLVDYPEKEDITKTNEQIGAKATIAPEMKRNSKTADGKKADVYSMAKTLWMLLTQNEYGFEGTYNPLSPLTNLEKFYRQEHLVELTSLLVEATQDEPSLRPSMREFSKRLEEYLEIYSDFDKSNLSQWQYIQTTLFKDHIPETTIWREKNEIIKVLNLLGAMPSLNHMFLSTGGGLDFDYAEISGEDGCIALHASASVYILKPLKLESHNIQKDFKWSFFRLEADALEPTNLSSIYKNTEYLTEHFPGKYIEWVYGNYGYYENDEPLPCNYRMITRVLSGSIVLFSKGSVYNDISGTYDARHNNFTSDEFRKYIEDLRKDENSMGYTAFLKKHNINPFVPKVKDEDDQDLSNIRKYAEVEILLKDYFRNTDVNQFCEKFTLEGNENVLNFTLQVDFGGGFFEPCFVLNSDGKFIESESSILHEPDNLNWFLFTDIESVKRFIDLVELDIDNICDSYALKRYPGDFYFSIKPIRNLPPKHLFSKEEIRKVLLSGNDHIENTLVIDGDGFAKLVQENNSSILRQYPVIHESYNAFNNYTGKYSSLEHLNDEYISSLQGWLIHLRKNGGCVRMDYVHNNSDEEQLLTEIKKFYL